MSNTRNELLRRAYIEFERLYDFHKLDHTQTLLYEEIENFLAAETEAEPVAWLIPGAVTVDASLAKANGNNATPLYTRPEPARKPMTEEYINAVAKAKGLNRLEAHFFLEGIRYAEKHYEIGRGME
jgi:hypothetical protein